MCCTLLITVLTRATSPHSFEKIYYLKSNQQQKKLLFCGQYSGMNGFAAKVELFYIVTSNICRCKPKLWKTIPQNSECSRIRTCASRDEIPPTDPHRKNISPASKKRQSSQIWILIGLSAPCWEVLYCNETPTWFKHQLRMWNRMLTNTTWHVFIFIWAFCNIKCYGRLQENILYNVNAFLK